jgi:hypothetical protein
MSTRPSAAALALLTTTRCPTSGLVIVAPLGRGRARGCLRLTLKVQRLRGKIIFSLRGWLLITMMILAIVTRDPAQLGRSCGNLVALLASSYLTD